jgi:hypothetical protein
MRRSEKRKKKETMQEKANGEWKRVVHVYVCKMSICVFMNALEVVYGDEVCVDAPRVFEYMATVLLLILIRWTARFSDCCVNM